MSEVTAPIMTDATGQSIDSKLNSLLGKMDNLAAAFQPNASGIVYSNTTSGLTGDDVQEAIDEMAADVSEIKSSLSDLVNITTFNQTLYRPGSATETQSATKVIINSSLKLAAFHYYGSTATTLSVGTVYQLGTIETVATPKELVVLPVNRDNGGNAIGQLYIDVDKKVYIKPLVSIPSGVVIRAYTMYFTV